MTPLRALVAWIAILAIILCVILLSGGRDCESPKYGPLAWIMKGERWIPTGAHAGRGDACKRIK